MEAPEHLNGQVVVVEVHDRTEAETRAQAPLLLERLRGLLNQGYKYLLLNVGELTYVDSVMLGAMIEAYSAALRHGGGLKLLHVNKRFRQLLTVTRLDGVFDSFESEDTAVASFPPAAQKKNREGERIRSACVKMALSEAARLRSRSCRARDAGSCS